MGVMKDWWTEYSFLLFNCEVTSCLVVLASIVLRNSEAVWLLSKVVLLRIPGTS